MYIYQDTKWPHFTYDSQKLFTLLEECHVEQGKLLAKMDILGLSEKEEKMLNTITSDILKSNEIEGFLLNKEKVRSSIARRLGIKISNSVNSDRNVDAIVEMMLDATQNYDKPITKERLLGWHACLFPTGYSGMNKIEVAQYRTGGMQVVSGGIGMEKVHYEAPPAADVEREMNQFFAWLNDDSLQGDLIIKAAVAHLWFLTIHPFEDGNGRIARTISDTLLCRSDRTKFRFYSMSNQISLDKKKYYRILEQTQHGPVDITDWLKWFLSCYNKAVAESQKQTETVLKKYAFLQKIANIPLNKRQSRMVSKLLDGSWFGVLNTSKWAKITKCSSDTALRDITDLVEKGVLEKNPTAGGRSTNYVILIKVQEGRNEENN